MLTTLLTVLAFLALTLASPSRIQKRYNGVRIQSYRDGTCLVPVSRVGRASSTDPVQRNWKNEESHHFSRDIWQSYPTLFQQTWYLTDDDRIAITGGNQCLDQGPDGPQTYQCTRGNTNQIWYVLFYNDPGTTPVPLPSPQGD